MPSLSGPARLFSMDNNPHGSIPNSECMLQPTIFGKIYPIFNRLWSILVVLSVSRVTESKTEAHSTYTFLALKISVCVVLIIVQK